MTIIFGIKYFQYFSNTVETLAEEKEEHNFNRLSKYHIQFWRWHFPIITT